LAGPEEVEALEPERVCLEMPPDLAERGRRLVAGRGWQEAEGQLVIYSRGLAVLEVEEAGAAEDESADRGLLPRLLELESSRAVLRYRTFWVQKDNRTLEMNLTGCRAENDGMRRTIASLRAEIETLRSLLQATRSTKVAIDFLARLGGTSALALLDQVAGSPDPLLRHAATIAAGNIEDARATTILKRFALDPSAGIRRLAIEGLANRSDPPAATMVRALGDPDRSVRAAARAALERLAGSAAPALEAMLAGRLAPAGGAWARWVARRETRWLLARLRSKG